MIRRLVQWTTLTGLGAALAATALLLADGQRQASALSGTRCIGCLGVPSPLLGLHLGAAVLIGLVWLVLAVGLMRWVSRRHGVPFRWRLVVLATLLLGGGMAQGAELWSLWQGDAGLQQSARMLGAINAVLLAAALLLALPGLWQVPGLAQLLGAAPAGQAQAAQDKAEPGEHGQLAQRTAELQAALDTANAALAEAQKTDQLKDTFLAMASHELRTPLQSTLYWADMLGRPHSADHAAEAAHHITHNVQVQSRLINDLLDMSRILTGQLRLEWSACDPVEVVEKAAEVVRTEAAARGITLQLQRPPEPVSMSSDPVRLEQVAWNLMSNAVHASPDGAAIRVQMQVEAGLFCLVVTDDGEGIEPQRLPQLFEAFAQGVRTTRHGGLGLGLPITHSIVRQFDGRIEAFSEGRGKGACFRVELPLRHAAPLA